MVKYRDLITGGLSVALAVVLYMISFGVKDFSAVRLGPGFVPRVTAVFLGILGVILIVQGIRNLRAAGAGDGTREKTDGGKSGHAVLLSFLLMAGYIALLDSLGFIITTSGYLFFQMVLLAHRSHRRYALFAFISVGTAAAAYYLFVGFFEVMIPAGILG